MAEKCVFLSSDYTVRGFQTGPQGGWVQLVGAGLGSHRDKLVNQFGGRVISTRNFSSSRLGMAGGEVKVSVKGDVAEICKSLA
jgi:hypothetical protein